MKRFLALLCALLATLALAACSATPAPTATATATLEASATPTAAATATPAATPSPEATLSAAVGISTTDFMGNTVTLDAVPQRIISLTPSNTETLFALGLGSKVVGVDAISNYPAEVASIEKVGDFSGPNLEKIASLKPDLVLAGDKLQKEIIEKLQALGLKVAAVEGTTYAEVFDSITMIGTLTGAADQAKALTDDLKAKEKIVKEAVAAHPSSKLAYIAISFGQYGDYSAGPGTFPYEMIQMCGARNVTEGLPAQWPQMTLEAIVKADPDVILVPHDAGDVKTFAATEGYKTLTASKKGQVYAFDADICTRPGPRIVEGFRLYAQILCGVTISFDK